MQTYPIILTPDDPGYVVYIPDFDRNTEGYDLNEALMMAEDAINMLGVAYEDDHIPVPAPSDYKTVLAQAGKDDIVTLISVDFDAYRRRTDNRSVKKNCTIPAWLNDKAMKAGINFSALLQAAIKAELNL